MLDSVTLAVLCVKILWESSKVIASPLLHLTYTSYSRVSLAFLMLTIKTCLRSNDMPINQTKSLQPPSATGTLITNRRLCFVHVIKHCLASSVVSQVCQSDHNLHFLT
jgi:hypothetical protein